jgi:CBS domain containing-hemolysin-like protein
MLMAIFTASETAFLCIDKAKVLYLAEERNMWSIITKKFFERPAQFFSTILVCEDFLIVVASNLAALYFIRNHGERWVFLSTISLSIISLIFGQLIPKSIALLYPEKTLRVTARIIFLLRVLLTPIVGLFTGISEGIAGLFRSGSESAIIRHQDIVFAISEYEKDTSLLTARLFDFSKRRVSETMVPITIALTCKKGDDFQRFCMESQRLFRYIPIWDDENKEVIGVVNTKEYFFTGEVKVRPPSFINENERCMQAFLKMKENGEHLAVVQDNDNNVIGIITIYDLIEELVGAIREER